MTRCNTISMVLIAGIGFLGASLVDAQPKVVVVPLGAGAKGNAVQSHVLKGKTFSNQNATSLTGTRPPAPVPKMRTGLTGLGVPWPNPRYSGNLTSGYIDHLTGLHWAMPHHLILTWHEAKDHCEDLVIITGSGPYYRRLDDWRLPTLRALHSLIDYSEKEPALPESHPFGIISNAPYWSRTREVDTIKFWTVDMADGRLDSKGWDEETAFVWCVRGGINE